MKKPVSKFAFRIFNLQRYIEGAVGERNAAMTELAETKGVLADARRELSQASNQASALVEAEAARDKAEAELMRTAQLTATAEKRLRRAEETANERAAECREAEARAGECEGLTTRLKPDHPKKKQK